MKHYRLAEFLSNFNVKPPRTNVKPPIDDCLATVLTTGVCRQKQLSFPGRQKQQHSLSCIWEILNSG